MTYLMTRDDPARAQPARQPARWTAPHSTRNAQGWERTPGAAPAPEIPPRDLPVGSAPVAGLLLRERQVRRAGVGSTSSLQRSLPPVFPRTLRVLALGAVLAPVAVVVYAHLRFDGAMERAQTIVAGLEITVLLLAATILARYIYHLGEAIEGYRPCVHGENDQVRMNVPHG